MKTTKKNEETNFVAPPKEYGQSVYSNMSLPLNEDYVAVGRAVHCLLREGWRFDGFCENKGQYSVLLSRIWNA